MHSVQTHYEEHLGPVYSWMAGGTESAITRGAAELEALGLVPSGTALAVDLGAGFGMHAIPLAEKGYRVLALDTCGALIEELRAGHAGLPIDAIEADLRAFARYLPDPPELVLCMGDTLTHLPDKRSVEELIGEIAASLPAGGHFVTSFRDYSRPLTGNARFIPVRSDPTRILTCFLEYAPETVTVHDILHQWDGARWQLDTSSYDKLRLSPDWLAGILADHGLPVQQDTNDAGMRRFVARRAG